MFILGENIEKKRQLIRENIYKPENIMQAFDEVCRNMKNKKKVNSYKDFKCVYISRIYNDLKSKNYKVGPYNEFTIYEPKERKIVSQGIYDKIINHLVARYILMPALISKLIKQNVASRENLGTRAGLAYHYRYMNLCKVKYGTFYILKFDISKFFASIDHDILKKKVERYIKDEDALKIVFDIIDSVESGLRNSVP